MTLISPLVPDKENNKNKKNHTLFRFLCVPSTVRLGVPVQSAPMPPRWTMPRKACPAVSVVAATRHLTDSKAVPPDKSDAIRRQAPRSNVAGMDLETAAEHSCTVEAFGGNEEEEEEELEGVVVVLVVVVGKLRRLLPGCVRCGEIEPTSSSSVRKEEDVATAGCVSECVVCRWMPREVPHGS